MTDLFNGVDTNTESKKEVNTPEVNKNEDGSIVIGDKFYKDVDALINSKVASDEHINLIQNENKVHKEEINTLRTDSKSANELGMNLEERIKQLKKSSGNDDLEPEYDVNDHKQSPPAFDREAIIKDIKSELQQDQTKQIELMENTRRIERQLVEDYGNEDLARKAFKAYKDSDIYDQDVVDSYTRTKPESLVKLIETVAPVKVVSFGKTPTIRRSSNTSITNIKGWSHYKKIMIEQPNKYKSVELQRELKDAIGASKAASIDFYTQ